MSDVFSKTLDLSMTDTGHGEQQSSYRVVIMQQDGYMSELWLPQNTEGRYVFEPDPEGLHYPVSVVAQGGRWVAVCEKEAFFVLNEMAVKHVEITDNALIEMNYRGEFYYLYVEEERRNDNLFLPYYIEKSDQIMIGRLPECDIFYDSPMVSRRHAILSWRDDRWYVIDNESTNGVYLNGRAVQMDQFSVGDNVYIMGLRIYMGVGYIAINNGNGRVQIMTPKLRHISSDNDVVFAPVPPVRQEKNFLNRMPRRRQLLNPEAIEIEAPPASISNKMPLLLSMGSPLLMGGRALATGNVFTAVTSMMMPMLTQGFSEKDRKDYEQKRQVKYREYLNCKISEIEREKVYEEKVLTEMYPDLQAALDFATNSERLWERQRRDADFLSVRIGKGEIPLVAEIKAPKQRFDLEEDELQEAMHSLADQKVTINNAPIMVSFQEHFVCGVNGSLEKTYSFIRNLIIQLALTHSYDELKIVLLADEECIRTMDYVLYLPHLWNNDRTIRYAAKNKSDAQQLSKELMKIYEDYSSEEAKRKRKSVSAPAYVIIAQSKVLFDSIEVFQDIATSQEFCGISLITAFSESLKETSALIRLGEKSVFMNLREPEVPEQSFVLDYFPEKYGLRQLHKLMDTKLQLKEQQFALPSMISFLDMFGVGKVEYLNPMKRWRDNNPVKSLAAEIGVGTDGKLFTLDLHEKKQGPHGLVAGSTGSGKSEFIITYLLSMAVNYSPDEVAFVLIDYKGGGLADAFVDKKRGIHLPHVVGTITNLDGAGIQRSLVSINSELKRRQALFSKAKSETGSGTMDIYDYQRFYRQKVVQEPLPHLFIVSDEFAELKKKQPDFMEELISTARIGRSLGVHLILATQKPTGVVNDQIWSNTKFRVCLKVADKGDSMEMLKRPEAAELKQTGRFYLQVGYNELFALGQSAWCGAPYVEEEEESEATVTYSVQFVDITGQVILNKKMKTKKKESEKKQIVVIVQHLSDLAKRENIIPRQLWKDSLPAKMEYTELEKLWNGSEKKVQALLGMVDDPERQAQFPLVLDMNSFHHFLIVGPSSSGKSSILRTMLWSLVNHYSPEEVQYYLVDLSAGALGVFRTMPHCGAYLAKENENDYNRLIAMIREIAMDRKKIFRDAEVTGYDSYIQIAKMPVILVMIDNYQTIFTEFARGPEIASNIHTLLAEVANCGIRFIFTINHSNEISTRAKMEIDGALSLNPKDRYEAGEILSSSVSSIPATLPGRGVCLVEKRPLEFHIAVYQVDKTEQSALFQVKEELKKLAEHYNDYQPARRLPSMNSGQTYEEFCLGIERERIGLGYSAKDMRTIVLPFQQWTTLPIYIGNRDGLRPVIRNLLHAAKCNQMEVKVVKRIEESVFDSLHNLLKDYEGEASIVKCVDEELTSLAQWLFQTVSSRTAVINEYTDSMGIPREEKGRAKKVSVYVREHTKPILVIFESFGDFVQNLNNGTALTYFRSFLKDLKGYNIYFAGCVEAKDRSLRMNELLENFVMSGTMLLFGGAYDKQCLTSDIPSEYRRIEKVKADYDRGFLVYRGEWYDIQMPCGSLERPNIVPGEEPII